VDTCDKKKRRRQTPIKEKKKEYHQSRTKNETVFSTHGPVVKWVRREDSQNPGSRCSREYVRRVEGSILVCSAGVRRSKSNACVSNARNHPMYIFFLFSIFFCCSICVALHAMSMSPSSDCYCS
jgi:hypothetical protein